MLCCGASLPPFPLDIDLTPHGCEDKVLSSFLTNVELCATFINIWKLAELIKASCLSAQVRSEEGLRLLSQWGGNKSYFVPNNDLVGEESLLFVLFA